LIRDTGEDEFVLTVDGSNFPMKQAISASGARYESTDGTETELWGKGDSVTLTVADKQYEDYNIWQPSGVIWLSDEALPVGIEWKVKSVSGTEILDGSTATITFQSGGTVYGSASVNSYRSSWLTAGGRLVLLPAAATMMMGPPELMEQENVFLKTLPEVTGFRLRHDGVTLLTKGEDTIELML